MLPTEHAYNHELISKLGLEQLSSEEITKKLEAYLERYWFSFDSDSQMRYFKVYERGLFSNLDRKTLEPIALTLMRESEVRELQ